MVIHSKRFAFLEPAKTKALATRIASVTAWWRETPDGKRLLGGRLRTPAQMVSAYRRGLRDLAREALENSLIVTGAGSAGHTRVVVAGEVVGHRVTNSAFSYLSMEVTDEQVDVIVQVGFFGGIVFEG